MPYFRYTGIASTGRFVRGTVGARSPAEVMLELHKHKVVGLHARAVRFGIMSRRVSSQIHISFFKQLAVLLNAGVHLDKALALMHEQIQHLWFKSAVYEIHTAVRDGQRFSDALQQERGLFTPMMVHMICTGQESGALSLCLENIGQYLEQRDVFLKKIRAAMMVPLMTFLFFVCIALVIFLAIVPFFSSLFTHSGQEIPAATRAMLGISAWLTGDHAPVVALLVGSLFYGGVRLMRRYAEIKDRIVLAMPLVGQATTASSLHAFFQSLGLLLKAGVHGRIALAIALETVSNGQLRRALQKATCAVEEGHLVHEALQEHASFVSPDIIAMLAIGQESGQLGMMAYQAAHACKQSVDRLLSHVTTFLQPVLMIILGLCIVCLIVAIYLPIFNLSVAIS